MTPAVITPAVVTLVVVTPIVIIPVVVTPIVIIPVGIDYEETFAPVARYSSIQMILALSAQMGWHIHQMDVKTAFLNGVIEEEVYVEKPEGFEVFSSELHVCRLKRELYGLKQAPRGWYTQIDNYFTGFGFSKSEADPNLYQIVVEGKLLIIMHNYSHN